MEEPGTDEGRSLSRTGGSAGGAGGGARPPGGDGAGADEAAEAPETVHVEVRRATSADSLFGESPITRPAPDPSEDDTVEEADEEEPTSREVAMWIVRAAFYAALRAGAGAFGAGLFMALCLGCFLPGDLGILLGMLLAGLSLPVGVFAGYATYKQTIETERARQGLCPRCGYDLRGINTERCPECGTRLRLPKPWLAGETERHGVEDEMD